MSLLDRHGTGRILFRNTREAIQGFPGRDCQPAPLPAPENWSKDGKLREQMWPEEAQLDGAWMEADPRVMWLMEKLRTDLKHKKCCSLHVVVPWLKRLKMYSVYMQVFVLQCSMKA